ncbi:lipid-A-disaccharide synthase [Bacteroidota bacterium]
MKYYIISGEASGDLHGSNLIKELSFLDEKAEYRVWGGDLMQEQGAEVVKHYRDLAFMGFIEVVQNLGTIMKNISFCKSDILSYNPDVVIFIDYPGFNLKIAEFAKKAGFKVFYYISPSLWAWNKSRIKIIRKYIDRMFVILPFEKPFYKELNYEVDFVGHPLLDSLTKLKGDFKEFCSENGLSEKKIIAILPGSRKQELKRMLPVMLSLCEYYSEYQFVIGGAPGLEADLYASYFKENKLPVIFEQTQRLLANATAAVVTSGTATLEAALFKVPEVVCYKGGAISYIIAKMLAKVDYISLPNLIMEKEIVKELIQKTMTLKNVKKELDNILYNKSYYSGMISNFDLLEEKLGGKGASKKTAEKIIAYL